MVRHQAYYEFLAATEPESPGWAPALAGLAVLDLVDAARDDASIIDADWTGVRAVSETVSSLREGNPLRRSLLRVVEQLRDEPDWSAITAGLFAYGRALDLEGSWKLATDVFGTVADFAREDRRPELAMEATTALGGAARRSGDWDRSAEGYAEAAHLANSLGDKASGLTVRVGTANTQIARGNIPAAEEILDEVIAEATNSGLDGVAALAYHSSATVAHLKGRYDSAVSLAHKALEKTTNPGVRDTLLADIAAAFMALGMHDAARDAYLITSLTSRYQWVRWQSEINLMELAAIDRMAGDFDQYADRLGKAALDPRLRSYFLLYHGQGCIALGREDEGRTQLAEAQRFAAAHRINQVAFEAEKALTNAGTDKSARRPAAGWDAPIPTAVLEVAESLTYLRDTARTSPRVAEWIAPA